MTCTTCDVLPTLITALVSRSRIPAQVRSQWVAIDIREEERTSGFSDADGFLSLPIVWTLMSQAWLNEHAAIEAMAAGEAYLIVTNSELTLTTDLSDPITFAYPGDSGIVQSSTADPAPAPSSSPPPRQPRCASLNTADLHSAYAFGDQYSDPRFPSYLGGVDPNNYIENRTLWLNGRQQFFADFDSWLLPPLMEIFGETPISMRCTLDSTCAALAAQNGCTFTADGAACRQEAYLQLMDASIVDPSLPRPHFPGMRLRAIDENGNGVAGLRVRLRQLNTQAYPDLPRVTEVVSCGVPTSDDLANGMADAVQLNGHSYMDGVSRPEGAMACVTDANGYVDMIVRYVEPLGVDVTLQQEYNLTIPSTPECALLPPQHPVPMRSSSPTPCDSAPPFRSPRAEQPDLPCAVADTCATRSPAACCSRTKPTALSRTTRPPPLAARRRSSSPSPSLRSAARR